MEIGVASDSKKRSTGGKRDARGRFVKGGPGGPGRPPRAVEEGYAELFRRVISEERMERILEEVAAQAEDGDLRAIEMLLRRAIPEQLAHQISQPTEIIIELPPDLRNRWTGGASDEPPS